MKKVFVAIAAFAAASSAMAGVTVSGGVGATNNEIYRGYSLSDKNPAVTGDARVSIKGTAAELFGGVRGSTTNNMNGVRSIARGELGVGADVLGVHTEVGVRENMLFGTGSHANTREAFVRGAAPLAGGTLTAEYNKQVAGPSFGKFGRPSYTAIGYSHALTGTPVTVGASVGYAGYNTGHKFNDVTLSAAFQVTKHVEVVGKQSIGGKDAFGYDIPSQTSVGIRYAF